MTPIEFVNQQHWQYKLSKDEIEIPCPFKSCPNFKQKQFYINKTTGKWYCHRSPNEKGQNIKHLAFKLGLINFQNPVKTTHIYISEKEIDDLNFVLLATQEPLNYLVNERGFKLSTIKQFKLGFTHYNGSPVIVIPDFDKTGTCVGKKYHFYTRPAGISKYTKEKGSKTQLFNLQHIDLNQPVIITEGEYDAMSLWQLGYENVGSIPNGAIGINEWIDEVKSGKEFYICFDNDSAGQEGAEKLAKQLGLSKCKRIYPRLKDINDYLQHGLDKSYIDKIITQAEPMFQAPVTSIEHYLEKTEYLLENPKQIKGVSTGWPCVDYYLGGIRSGEVTVTSGVTGHGKTTFAEALIGNLIQKDVNCLIVSPEMQEETILIDLANNHYQTQAYNIKKLQKFVTTYSKRVYIARVFDQWTDKSKRLLDRVFDIIEYSIRNHNVKFILLDHLRLFLKPKDQEGERFSIDEFMQRCVHTAIANNVHIWLIVQPKNLPANQKRVTMSDLKGSSNISQDAHNIILIHRNMDFKKAENLVQLEIAKNRALGTLGIANLGFNLESRANYDEIKS